MASYPESPTVLRELDDHGVLLLSLNRPERNNGWTVEMEETYFGCLIAAANDPTVRVIVVTGVGRTFCPGLDMQVLSESAKGGRIQQAGGRWPMTMARMIPKPVIAAVNGAAAGIGFIQMASADLRFVASTAKLTTSFARRGLPAENSLSWILPRLIGTGAAMDLLLSGRVILADEALRIGLANRVCEPDQVVAEALAYARDMAVNCSPNSMAAIKNQVNADWEQSSEASRLASLELIDITSTHPDFREGVTSFTERRAPAFDGLSAGIDIPKAIW